ncbi:MAG TPA: hypothetical protein VLH10_22190 [Yinghuangia sp.]|nr:hypothetical protein [Yinghuangia sp.]
MDQAVDPLEVDQRTDPERRHVTDTGLYLGKPSAQTVRIAPEEPAQRQVSDTARPQCREPRHVDRRALRRGAFAPDDELRDAETAELGYFLIERQFGQQLCDVVGGPRTSGHAEISLS